MRALLASVLILAAAGCDSAAPTTPTPVGPTPTNATALFPARQNGQHVFLDSTGRVAVTLVKHNATRAGGEGLAPARFWDGRRNVWEFFDAAGQVALSIPADEVTAPSGGLILVSVDGRRGFVDRAGAYVVNPYLNDARPFREGVARVKTTGWQWGIMDTSGRIVAPPQWGELWDAADGRMRFRENDLYGFVDLAGTEVIPPVYADARSFSGGLAAVREGERWGFITPANARAMGGATFISAGDFREGLAPVRTENRWEYVDASGARAIGPEFEEARAFFQGRAAVRIDGRWTHIDRSGAPIRPATFDEVGDFAGGLASVTVGGRTGYVDRAGTMVWVPRD